MGASLGAMEAEQAAWTIPDGVLRANLRDALTEDFLPPYEAFLARNAAAGGGRVSDKYIKYSVCLSANRLTLHDLHLHIDMFALPHVLAAPVWQVFAMGTMWARDLKIAASKGVNIGRAVAGAVVDDAESKCDACRWRMCASSSTTRYSRAGIARSARARHERQCAPACVKSESDRESGL